MAENNRLPAVHSGIPLVKRRSLKLGDAPCLAIGEEHGVDDQADQDQADGESGKAEAAPEFHLVGQGRRHHHPGQLAALLQLTVLPRTVALELFERHSFGENHRVHGESFGAEVRVEEVHHENETHGEKGFIAMDGGGDIDGPAGEYAREDLRKPQHKAGTTDHGDAPEHREISEFFPTGPNTAIRWWSPLGWIGY